METSEDQGTITENVERTMYGDMCHKLAVLVQKILEFVPVYEALQPPRSGMQALCGLHWAVERAKLFLQRTVNSSKLYLAITSDSITTKFEKVKENLDKSLRRLEENVPDDLAQQISLFISDLQEINCQPDASDQEAGNEIISLLQKEKEVPGFNASTELDVFDQVVVKLGIKTGKAISAEKRALRRLLEKTRREEDKKKELIVLYLLHLLRKYTKVFDFTNTEEGSVADVTSSCPPSPSDRGSEASTSGRDSDFSSELCCFEIYHKRLGSSNREGLSCLRHSFLIPPEEFRCPISLQLMSDPVIISSGQTYERVCIEKWFEEGHDTCPKTQQKLAHLGVTPNFCVKGLITSWCEKHSVPLPTPPSPPPSPVTNWRYSHFSGSASLKSSSPHPRGLTIFANGALRSSFAATTNDDCSIMTTDDSVGDSCCSSLGGAMKRRMMDGSDAIQRSLYLLSSSNLAMQRRGAEEIRLLTKDSDDARLYISESGSIAALVDFLKAAVNAEAVDAQETACLALLNVAINNNRNKAEIVEGETIPWLIKILSSEAPLPVKEAAIAVLLTTSCLDENKPAIGSSGSVRFLVEHLEVGSSQGVKDALTALFNLSIFSGNYACLVKDGAIPKLFHLLSLGDVDLIEKCITILYNLASIEEGRSAIVEGDGGVSTLVEFLDTGSPKEKELVVCILLTICTNNHEHSQLVLREGVIPALVMLSVSGNARAKDKALKLLQHFREERQKDSNWHNSAQVPCTMESQNGKDIHGKADKGFFKRKAFGFFRKSKSFSFYHC